MSTFLHGKGFSAEQMRERFGHLRHEFGVFAARAAEAMREEPAARYAIVKGDSFTTWHCSRDATQYAYLTFGGQPFLSQELSDRGLEAVLGIFPEFRPSAAVPSAQCRPSEAPLPTTGVSSESVSA